MRPLLAGVALDLAIGDPPWLPHPIRALGALITAGEEICRRLPVPTRVAGVVLCAGTVGVACGVVRLTLPWAAAYWTFSFLALRDLDRQAGLVVKHLEAGDIAEARRSLSMIVGRDTEHLTEPEILRAVIETVSENLSDGVIAPLFYYALGGPVAMAAYKAINTLDSMVGYRNERYRELGWCSARVDDVANFLPARLTAGLIWLTAAVLRLDVRRSVAATFRDASLQPSPNSGYPEAAVAGALGIRLGGLNHYGGKPSLKAPLGDDLKPIDREAFRQTRRILYGATAFFVAAILVFRHDR